MGSSSSMSSLALQERTRREILQKSDLIPSLPDVVLEVLRLVNDKGTEIQQFEDLLKNDGPLVAKMLRVVNSPFYAVQSRVTSIGQAVMVLGFRSLRSLVLAASTANYMERDYGCYGYAPKGLWKHAISVASGARTLAKELRFHPELREEVFVAGLLHDIGKMLLAPYLTDCGVKLDSGGGAASQGEATHIGIDHQEAGRLVAEKWGLSPLVREIISKHHEDCCADEYRDAHAAVRLANAFAHEEGYGLLEPKHVDDCGEGDLARLGISQDDWADIKVDVREAMESSAQALTSLGS